MTYNIDVGTLSTTPTLITTTTVTDVYHAKKSTTILSVVAANYDAGSVNYTLELYDTANTTSYYLYKTSSISAHSREIYSEPFVLKSGWKLRVTAATANKLTMLVTYCQPDATALRQMGS